MFRYGGRMATNRRYEYKGRNRRGTGVVGVFTGSDPGEGLILRAFRARWQDLTVTDPEGIEVGGITRVDGVRTWWSGF